MLRALRNQAATTSAYCPQNGALVPPLSVFHNVYMGRLSEYSTLKNIRNLVYPQASELHRINDLITTLGLEDKLRVSVDKLSGGEAQRTALARALYQQAPILLADEPVSSIDEKQGKQLLKTALESHAIAVVALHNQALARECFTRVVGLHQGNIILDRPANLVTDDDLIELYPSSKNSNKNSSRNSGRNSNTNNADTD